MYITIKQLKTFLNEQKSIDDELDVTLTEHNVDYVELINDISAFVHDFIHENMRDFLHVDDIVDEIMDKLYDGSQMYSTIILILTPLQKTQLDIVLAEKIGTIASNYYSSYI